MAIRSPTASASVRSLVTSRIVRAARYLLNSFHTSLLDSASNPLVGLSKIITCIWKDTHTLAVRFETKHHVSNMYYFAQKCIKNKSERHKIKRAATRLGTFLPLSATMGIAYFYNPKHKWWSVGWVEYRLLNTTEMRMLV